MHFALGDEADERRIDRGCAEIDEVLQLTLRTDDQLLETMTVWLVRGRCNALRLGGVHVEYPKKVSHVAKVIHRAFLLQTVQ